MGVVARQGIYLSYCMGNPLFYAILLCLDYSRRHDGVRLVCSVPRLKCRNFYVPRGDLLSSWRVNVHDKDNDLFYAGSYDCFNSDFFLKVRSLFINSVKGIFFEPFIFPLFNSFLASGCRPKNLFTTSKNLKIM